ncbi:FAD-binding oxidoreductase [Streptomyces sp. NPDC018347]|uniref:FAD-binding oxidoreductase n=1 Tax=Streptomyces sp. NPDC018347 TaxID=3157193 RepID=UPI003400D0FB
MRDEQLRTFVPDGCLVLPSSPRYDVARQVYNRMHDHRPAAILRSLDEAVLRKALTGAAALEVPVAVRGGGHHIGGFSTVDGGLVIDFSVFRDVAHDPDTRTARVRPGARLGDLDARLAAYGRCVPSGTVGDTGITGLTLGGGIGWLVAGQGLTCDHLSGARVPLADGRVLEVSRDHHPDLFHALRGGGAGAFGVILELRFRTLPLPRITAGSVRFPLDRAAGFDSSSLPPLRGYRKSTHSTRLAFDPDLISGALRAAPTARCSVLLEYFNTDTLHAHADGSACPCGSHGWASRCRRGGRTGRRTTHTSTGGAPGPSGCGPGTTACGRTPTTPTRPTPTRACPAATGGSATASDGWRRRTTRAACSHEATGPGSPRAADPGPA